MAAKITLTLTKDKFGTDEAMAQTLALHPAVRLDGKVLNDWSVSHVPTGLQIIVVHGPRAGRVAFRLLSALSFTTIDERLLRRCNAVVNKLRKRYIAVLYPRNKFRMWREGEVRS